MILEVESGGVITRALAYVHFDIPVDVDGETEHGVHAPLLSYPVGFDQWEPFAEIEGCEG